MKTQLWQSRVDYFSYSTHFIFLLCIVVKPPVFVNRHPTRTYWQSLPRSTHARPSSNLPFRFPHMWYCPWTAACLLDCGLWTCWSFIVLDRRVAVEGSATKRTSTTKLLCVTRTLSCLVQMTVSSGIGTVPKCKFKTWFCVVNIFGLRAFRSFSVTRNYGWE